MDMKWLETRKKKSVKESNIMEWRAIEDQAHMEAMTQGVDEIDNSQVSSIHFDQEKDFCDPEIKKIINKYLRKIKKRKTTRLEKLFGSCDKEGLHFGFFELYLLAVSV